MAVANKAENASGRLLYLTQWAYQHGSWLLNPTDLCVCVNRGTRGDHQNADRELALAESTIPRHKARQRILGALLPDDDSEETNKIRRGLEYAELLPPDTMRYYSYVGLWLGRPCYIRSGGGYAKVENDNHHISLLFAPEMDGLKLERLRSGAQDKVDQWKYHRINPVQRPLHMGIGRRVCCCGPSVLGDRWRTIWK